MKRNKPLKRKTPMKRGGPLKKVSKRRAKENREYTELRKKFLTENPYCQITGLPATDIHHRAGREGALLNKVEFWMAVSREAHIWLHDNPRESREKGWIID